MGIRNCEKKITTGLVRTQKVKSCKIHWCINYNNKISYIISLL